MNNNDNNIEILDDFDFDLENDLGINEINNNIENQEIIENENLEQSQFENVFGTENIVNETDNNIEKNVEEKKEPESNSNFDNEKKEEKEELENPMVEIVNNKQTMRLILIMLIVLFIAVFFMPKFFEIING